MTNDFTTSEHLPIPEQKAERKLTFLFWNMNGKHLLDCIARLVVNNVDVLILAECSSTPLELLATLNPIGHMARFQYASGQCKRILLFTRFSTELIVPVLEGDRYTIRRLHFPDDDEILLAAVHLLSLKEATERTLYGEAERFAEVVRRLEVERKHFRTIVVGDLNLNPFSDGVLSATGLHAVMSQSIARRKARTIQQHSYPFFYNPMWRMMGGSADADVGRRSPPGTYYYANADHVCYFWNTFDQVLIRPDLLDRWNDQHLQILTTDGTTDFLSKRNQLPGGLYRSDHLPLLFKLALPEAKDTDT